MKSRHVSFAQSGEPHVSRIVTGRQWILLPFAPNATPSGGEILHQLRPTGPIVKDGHAITFGGEQTHSAKAGLQFHCLAHNQHRPCTWPEYPTSSPRQTRSRPDDGHTNTPHTPSNNRAKYRPIVAVHASIRIIRPETTIATRIVVLQCFQPRSIRRDRPRKRSKHGRNPISAPCEGRPFRLPFVVQSGNRSQRTQRHRPRRMID